MRVLFTIQPAVGHFNPLVPLGRALVDAGHEVVFATSRSFCPTVEAAGLRAIPAGLDWLESEPGRAFPELDERPVAEQTPLMMKIFSDATLRAMLGDLLVLGPTWKPDVIVREYWEFGGYVAAELMGIPHVTAGIGVFLPLAVLREFFLPSIDAVRREYGMEPDPDASRMFGDLYLHFLPPSYQPVDAVLPIAKVVRPTVFDRSRDDALPAWIDALPGRPTVYATLGTVVNQTVEVFASILAGLRDEPVNLVLTVGRNGDPARFGPQPDNVRIERYIPQTLLLPRCDLVISHGGYNTVMASLSAGLPMLLLPLFADQPFHAQRCTELGAALTLSPVEVSAASIRKAALDLLENPSYRARAEGLRREIEALPGPERAVDLLVDLVERRRPGGASPGAKARGL